MCIGDLLCARHTVLDSTDHLCVWRVWLEGGLPPALTPISGVPQDAARCGTPAAPPGTGEDLVPSVRCVCASALHALLCLPPAAEVLEPLLALLQHLPPAELLSPAAPAQLAAGPPGHGVYGGAGGPGGQVPGIQ